MIAPGNNGCMFSKISFLLKCDVLMFFFLGGGVPKSEHVWVRLVEKIIRVRQINHLEDNLKL